jgi:hypothetical protein
VRTLFTLTTLVLLITTWELRAAEADGALIGPPAAAQDSAKAEPAAGSAATSASNPERWDRLFNGRNLDGWYTFLQKHGKNRDPDRVITIEENMIHLYKDAPDGSEVVMGYIATEKEYGDYHLRFQLRWGTKKFQPRYQLKRDAGLYYHIIGPDAVWPTALQYQIEQTDVGDLLALYGFMVDTWIDPKTKNEKQATFLDLEHGGEPRVLGGKGIGYQKRLPGPFEKEGWNTVEIVVRGDTTTHLLNGHIVNRGRGIRYADPKRPGLIRQITRGRIALEIEAAEIYFRDVEIQSTGSRQFLDSEKLEKS